MIADYPIEKSVVLNAIYDMTERMDIRLLKTNSRTGYIQFQEKSGQYDGVMDVTSGQNEDGLYTRIEMDQISSPEIGLVILDEIGSGIQFYLRQCNSCKNT